MLLNFPLESVKSIENPNIEFIYINNFFNFVNGIVLTINDIKDRLPKLSKIKIKIRDFSNCKEFVFIKRNDIDLNNITLNLLEDNIEINDFDIINVNLEIVPKKIFSVLKSFKGIKNFKFSFGKIIKYENIDNNVELIDIVVNIYYIYKEVKQVDINILKLLNLDNLLIYGHILNEMKTLKFYINKERSEANEIDTDFEIFENDYINNIMRKKNFPFSDSNNTMFFNNNSFFVPFIEDIILKISNKELNKFLNNYYIFLRDINLYNINILLLYQIQNNYIKNINIFYLDNEYDFSFKNKNKNEFNLRFIYSNFPCLQSIKLNFKNHKIIFKKSILSLISFNIYYENNDKNKLVIDFGINEIILKNLKNKKFRNYLFNNCEGYIIFKINDLEFIHNGYKSLKAPFDFDNTILNILIFFYLITFYIIFLIELVYLI